MELSELNTSKFKYDPKSETFVSDLEKIEEFNFDYEKYEKKKLCIFISLMCDPQSDIRKTFTYYPERKKQAALCSGFKTNKTNKFDEELEAYFVGQHDDFNAAIVKYLSLTYDAAFVRYHIFQQLQYIALQKALSDGDHKYVTLAENLTVKLKEEEKFIFGGEEVTSMRKALYLESAKKELDFKPEDIAYGLAEGNEFKDFSPYGEKYNIDGFKFKSDVEPKK